MCAHKEREVKVTGNSKIGDFQAQKHLRWRLVGLDE